MDGSPQLLTDVKFNQLKRGGYDPDQVDNFLERVSAAVAQLQDKLRQATDRAESADAQIAEARRKQAEAEAEARAGAGGAGAAAPVGGDEELTKVLVLAQRAADQAVSEANSTATRTVADARAKAVNLLAEAEQERDRMLTKARKKADSAAEERALELHRQVTELEAVRVDLQHDVELLQGHLEAERARLHAQLTAIATIIDEPGGLAVAEEPALRNTPIPEAELDATPERPSGEQQAAATGAGDGVADMQEGPVDPGDVGPVDGAPPGDGDVPDAPTGLEASPAEPDQAEAIEPEAAESDEAHPDGSGQAEQASVISIGAEGDRSDDEVEGDTTIDLSSERLFGADDGGIDDGGPPTELFSPSVADTAPEPEGKAGDSPLGEPDAAADAAMRAFFERDLDEEPESAKPRFGRRR